MHHGETDSDLWRLRWDRFGDSQAFTGRGHELHLVGRNKEKLALLATEREAGYTVGDVCEESLFPQESILANEQVASAVTELHPLKKLGASADFAYNPYRVNVGLIGWVPTAHDGAFISPAYVVFSIDKNVILPELLWFILKSEFFNKKLHPLCRFYN